MQRGIGFTEGKRVSLFDFAKAFGLVVVNSSFPKEEYLVTFCISVAKTQIGFFLLGKN